MWLDEWQPSQTFHFSLFHCIGAYPTVLNCLTRVIPNFDQDRLGQSGVNTLLFMTQTVIYARDICTSVALLYTGLTAKCSFRKTEFSHGSFTANTIVQSGCVTLTYRCCHSISDIFSQVEIPASVSPTRIWTWDFICTRSKNSNHCVTLPPKNPRCSHFGHVCVHNAPEVRILTCHTPP